MQTEHIVLNIYQGDDLISEQSVSLLYAGSRLVQASMEDDTPLDPDTMANLIGIIAKESGR